MDDIVTKFESLVAELETKLGNLEAAKSYLEEKENEENFIDLVVNLRSVADKATEIYDASDNVICSLEAALSESESWDYMLQHTFEKLGYRYLVPRHGTTDNWAEALMELASAIKQETPPVVVHNSKLLGRLLDAYKCGEVSG